MRLYNASSSPRSISRSRSDLERCLCSTIDQNYYHHHTPRTPKKKHGYAGWEKLVKEKCSKSAVTGVGTELGAKRSISRSGEVERCVCSAIDQNHHHNHYTPRTRKKKSTNTRANSQTASQPFCQTRHESQHLGLLARAAPGRASTQVLGVEL